MKNNSNIRHESLLTALPDSSPSATEAPFLQLFINHLASTDICFAIPELPEWIACDREAVDIIIYEKDLKIFKALIFEISKQNDLVPIQQITLGRSIFFFFRNSSLEVDSNFQIMKVAVHNGCSRRRRFNLSAEELLKDRIYLSDNKLWTLSYSNLFFYCLIRSVEEKKFEQEQYYRLSKCWQLARFDIEQQLKKYLQKNSINILKSCFDGQNRSYSEANVNLLSIRLRKDEKAGIKYLIIDRIHSLKSAIKPAGLIIGLLGRDGSGKSTFIDAITHTIGRCFLNVVFFKKHPRFLYKKPILNKSEYDLSKPHLHNERGYFASFIKLNLLLIEFLAGYWLKVFSFKRKACLVLYDRYFIDVLADPLRYRIKGNKLFIKLIHHILPQPDMWIILDLSTEVLMQRKQELSHEMSEKLRQEYLNLQNILPNCVVINNEGELQKTVDNATAHILNYMQQKTSKVS